MIQDRGVAGSRLLLKMTFNVRVRCPMIMRQAGYVFPSLMLHGVCFVALAGAPLSDPLGPQFEAIEYVTITEEGGGRLGNDSSIGDATEPELVPEKKFRRVKPTPVRRASVAKRDEAVEHEVTEEGAGDPDPSVAAADDQAAMAANHAIAMGSAGTDPLAARAGSGSGGEGVDRRSALRAWLHEIQREVNKIATRNYPSSAVRMKLEGKLRLGITIGSDGRVIEVRVLSSSGHSVLDEAATSSVMALHIPAPPDELGWREREIALPIRYALQ